MSTPVVAIGFILLIPSVLGMVFSAFMVFGITGVGHRDESSVTQAYDEATAEMQRERIPKEIYDPILSTMYSDPARVDEEILMLQQTWIGPQPNWRAVRDSTARLKTHLANTSSIDGVARVLGTGFAVVMGIASFVGGLLGWLLVMKKRVLQCQVCGAVVNAS